MTAKPNIDRALERLLAYAAEWSGFQVESVAREAIRRALEPQLTTDASIQDVMRRAAEHDPALVKLLRDAVGVRETYLFRNPDQFELIASHVPALVAGGVVRAWSAACATGEEAWSLAATISASSGLDADPTRLLVIGTDIHEPAVEHARAGTYRLGARRESGPILYPTFTTVGARLVIDEPLRAITSFAVHDLRDAPPGEFELIMCRNVLIYFTREVALGIVANLTRALVPGGLLVFGTMDIDAGDVPQLVRVGKPELMAFTRRPAGRARARPASLQVPSRISAATADAVKVPARAFELHRSALMWIEIGGGASAEKTLAELTRKHPDYVPGLLERAMSHARRGDRDAAITWMGEVVKRLRGLPDDQPVHGLEVLPVSFYRATAQAYLERAEKP